MLCEHFLSILQSEKCATSIKGKMEEFDEHIYLSLPINAE